MPRMRLAMPSARKTSSLSVVSPMPAKTMGAPVTSLMESAAPPRASPSSLVRITPLTLSRSWNEREVLTASWPIIESTTRKMLSGEVLALMSASSCMSGSSMARRPAVS